MARRTGGEFSTMHVHGEKDGTLRCYKGACPLGCNQKNEMSSLYSHCSILSRLQYLPGMSGHVIDDSTYSEFPISCIY